METKICRNCGQEKLLTDFSSTIRKRTRCPDRVSYSLDCKPCASKKSYAHQRGAGLAIQEVYRHSENYIRSQKNGWLLKTYHRTIDWYDEQFAKQNGNCAICGKPETRLGAGGRVKALAVDHDHACCSGQISCGKCIRGLLCEGCNHTLGFIRDDVKSLEAAILYLKSFEKVQQGETQCLTPQQFDGRLQERSN